MKGEDVTTHFSVILPTHDRAYVLWRAVQSVFAQSEESWELIVVDDGSTDCTLRLLEEFRDERVIVSSIANCGPSATRNHGIGLARSPYIAYIDSDNAWHPEFLAEMRRQIELHPDCVLWYCGQHTIIWERSLDGQWAMKLERDELRDAYSLDDVWNLKAADTNCIVHRRDIMESLGGWDEECSYLEDWDLFLRVSLAHPGRVVWVPRVLVDYRQVHGESHDGLCAEVQALGAKGLEAREYLRKKWGSRREFRGRQRL